MKATLIKILGKIFIKSDYNGEFISALKHIIPPKNRRWNSAFPIGFYYRLMTSIPVEKLSNEAYILNNIKTLCDSGLLKKTWEVDESYFETVRDLCLKHFLEVYLQEDENITRIIASETLPYDMVNNSQEKLIEDAEQYRPGEIVRFRWAYDTVSSPDSRKEELNFQFYFLEEDRWVFATNFSRGPREEIAPNISSTTARFEVKYLDKMYMYTWEGSFYCPRNSIFKFKGSFYLVLDENEVENLGDDIEGWAKARQITEYQKILLRIDEINRDRFNLEGLVRAKPFEIVDIESTAKPFAPDKSFEIIE
ncbi:MAG: hypothetical protein ABRQ39_04525 [Candidatus Eremiobacterota bacterium]